MTEQLPSLSIPEAEKIAYTEADVHSKLFEPDLAALGYPPRTSTQAGGEYFLEQHRLAMRRLASGKQRGHYDGLYMVGNSPVVLCEVKRYEAIDSKAAFERAVKQLQNYALSEDFDRPPPFLLLYSGRPEQTRFYRLRQMADGTMLDAAAYEELPEIWEWSRIRDAHVKGEFAEEVVDRKRLLEILLYHLDAVETDMQAPVTHAVEIVAGAEPPEMLTEFGNWLVGHEEARRQVSLLYQRKIAELPGSATRKQITEEMVTQAALNHINKVFFLNLCEDRNLDGFYRIMREFLPTSRADATATEAAVFLGLLRRKIRDSSGSWDIEEERSYRELRSRLAPQIGASVIEQNNWWELIRVAFDIAGERFPLVYREDPYDYFRAETETLADLVYDLSTKSFKGLTNRHVGDIYQGLLSSRQQTDEGRGGRRRQQAKLGAFYTPKADVDYMVSKLGLERDSRVLDPCMGSGHFLEGIYENLRSKYEEAGFARDEAHAAIIRNQIHGGDIDTFATALAAIRIFLLDEKSTEAAHNLYVHDMLLHTPERPASELFSGDALESRGTTGPDSVTRGELDPETDQPAKVDEISFDAVVGNPPYGAKVPAYKKDFYRQLYGATDTAIEKGSRGTGDGDSYAMFFASGIERLREGGRLSFITSDSFRSLTTHKELRRLILDRCKIVEILLTNTDHFEGVSFKFAGMAITTLEKCSDADARANNEMRLVDLVRDPAEFASPPPEKVTVIRQQEYETLPETPFWVGIPREIFEAARDSERIRDVARGRVGLQTGDDKRFLAGITHDYPGLPAAVDSTAVATSVSDEEQAEGIPPNKPAWVPFAKGGGFGEYWRDPDVAIDWSQESVKELERRNSWKSGTPRKAYIRNRDHYFKGGLTYSVISSGRISVRRLPEGWVFGHKGSAIFAKEGVSELFLLGYLNSALATYFMKRIVNTTATADIGYIEKLPYRRPKQDLEAEAVEQVEAIIASLQADPEADISQRRDRIDELVFDLFGIKSERQTVLDHYRDVGRVEQAVN